MNVKTKQKVLDRSQGTQLESKENGNTLYTVKDVCQITGLTRKQLFDYQKMVPPVSHDKSGYKLYDDDSIVRLVTIAELRSIDMPLIKIGKVIEGKCDREIAIKNQINALEERKKAVEEMLVYARRLIDSD